MAETEEERRALIDRVLNGEETVAPKIERVTPTLFLDDEGKEKSATELARGANYEGKKPVVESDPIIPQSIMDTIEMQAKSLPILRNIMGTNEKDEVRAYEVGKKLGLNPQALLDNADLDREATLAYEGQRNRDFLNGKPFSPKTLQELYPEVDVNDTVAATMALRDYNDLRQTRNIVDGAWEMAGIMPILRKEGMRQTDEDSLLMSKSNSIMDAWNAGTRDIEASKIMEANMKGAISDEDAKKQIEELYAGEKEYEKKKRGVFNLVIDDTVRNVSNMTQMTMEGLKDIVETLGPQAAPMIRQLAQSAAIAGGSLAAVGFGAAPVAVGGAIAGIGIGAISLFVGSYKQQRAQNYWDMMQKRTKAGAPLYNKQEAARRASVQAFWQAGLETVGVEVVIGRPIAKVFGGDVSKAIIQNATARNAIMTAGRNAIRKETAKAAAKQFAVGSAFELSEEGMQQAAKDIDETVFGNDPKTVNEIFWNAVEAMAEAAPAVIGMTLPGAALHGAGAYRGYRSLQKMDMKDAVEEYKRETEKDMVSALLEQREKNNLYKKSPEVYGKTIQAQMERSGKDTLYIDVASIAETDEGRAALSELADKKIATIEEIQNAVENNTPLEVKPGVYMQEVTQETAEVISDNATFDKGGRTLAAIQKSREHYKNVMAKWEEKAAEREAKAVDAFVDEILPSKQKGEDFLAGSEIEDEQISFREKERAVLKEVLAEDVNHPAEALKRAEEKAREEFYDITGSAQEKADYIRQHAGTVELIQDFREKQYANVRVSSNDSWYRVLYKKLGKKPTIRDAEDAAYDEAYRQADAAGDAEWKDALKAAKERRDVLYSLKGVVDAIDTEDLTARASLSQEAYNQIYVPTMNTLKGANPEVAKAAKDSALILARQADLFHELYGVSYEDAARVVLGDRAAAGGYRQDIQVISGKELSDEASEIIKQEIKNFKTEDFSPDKIDPNIYTEISKGTTDEIFNGTLEIVRKYVNEDIEDPLGNKVRFEQPENETIEEYVLHLIAGHEEQWDETSRSRALGVRLVAQTIQNPMAIILQENGRRAYLSLYSDGMNRLHQVVVGVQEDEDGRIITSFVKDGKRGKKNAPVNNFKNKIAASKKVLYIRGLNDRQGLSGHSRPQVVQWASKLSAALHPSGNSIVPQTVGNGNIFEQPAWHGSPYTFDKFPTLNTYNQEVNALAAEARLLADEKAWAYALDHLKERNGKPIRVMQTPLVMQLAGIKNLPIYMDISKIQNILKTHPEMTPDVLKKIPRALTDPVMISYSNSTNDRIVVILDLQAENGIPVIVPFELEVRKNAVMANVITSAYTKTIEEDGKVRPNYEWVREHVGTGLLYVNREKAPAALGMSKQKAMSFLSPAGVQFPMGRKQHSSLTLRIPDERDLVKLREQNPTQYQKQGTRYAGQYSEAENLIRIFSAGNASTVIHESAHAWLSMLERLAKDEAEKRGLVGTTDEILSALYSNPSVNQNMIKDLATIREWARYSPEALAEYKGTALEKEFAKHAEDVVRGIPGAEERFIQERFARAFERYLMTGKAPAKSLRTPFRRFKAWLTEIYKTVKSLGQNDAPKEITRIFDHMLATKEEIDAWAAEKKLISQNLPLDYSATEKENIERWQEEVKESAKEKCMASYMEKTTGDLTKNFEDSLDMLKDEFRKQLVAENPIYQIETMKKLHSTKKDWQSFLAEQGYTEETYETAIAEAGGHMDARIDKMIEDARAQYDANIMTPENIRAMAEAELATPEGMQELVEIETKMMNDRISKYIRTAAASLIEIHHTEDISHIAYDIKKRNGLTTAEDEKAYEAEREKEKNAAEKGALRERAQNAEAEKAKLRGEIKARMESLRTARDILNWKARDLRQKAESTLAKESVSKATNWKWWDNKAKSAAIRVSDAIKKGDWMTAAAEKRNEAYYSMMSRVAHENEQTMKKVLRGDPKTADPNDKEGMAKYGVMGILNRIGRKEKPVLMMEQARYFCQHFAYQMGLIGKDGVLPVNENGNVVDFSWVALSRELNPTQAMTAEAAGGIYDGADVIAPWIKTLFDSENKTLVGTLSFERFLDAMDAIRAAYKIGRREYEGNTLRLDGEPISFDEAAEKLILSKWTGKIEVPYFAKQRETGLARKGKALKRVVTELTLPEILWERLGDAWYQLFYQTVDRAANIERTMMEEASTNIGKTVNHYTRKEWQAIRNDKKYRLGNDETGKPVYYTKETVIAAALNWGSGANRARLTETLRVRRDEVEDFIFRNMEDKDWDFVEAVWKHINSYYPARNAVQDHLYGVPLGKVKAYTFTLPSGRIIHGDYYPIKYDAETASVSAERSVNEIIQQGMMGVSTFGLGMGSTKQRTFTSGGQNLRLDLEVYLDHVAEAVHHIAMREATVDVYKLISRKDVTDNIIERVGIDTYNTLKQWAADQWHSPIDRMTNFEKILTRLRRHMTFASMAYRASTAILNVANIFPVMEKMGPTNALYALGDYYTGDVRKKRAFVMEKSSFMRGRQTNMERDFARERKLPVGQHTIKGVAMAEGALEEVNSFGYWAIVETDFMLSLPQWIATYKKTRQELSAKGITAEEIDAEAVRRADKAVRETFGSGEVKDQTAVMKSKFLGQITPFYSYTALVMNQFIRAGYIASDTGNPRKLIKTVFYWWILNAIAESALRQMMASASGDDREDYWQRLIYSFSGAGPVGGVPIARDIVPWMAAKSMGLYKGDGKSEISALAVADDAMQVWSDLMAEDPSWLNVGRDATRVGNRIVGASDTLTDGFWNLLKLLTTDTDKTALEIIASFILDKDIQKKGGKK